MTWLYLLAGHFRTLFPLAMKVLVRSTPAWMDLTKMDLASFMVNTWGVHQKEIHFVRVCHFFYLYDVIVRYYCLVNDLKSFAFTGSRKTLSQDLATDSYYSTFHTNPERKKFSEEEYAAFTREETHKAMKQLVSSPDFNRWALANVDRISVTPPQRTPQNSMSQQRKRLFGLF